ncbi:hypothetical protein DFQ29_004736 [Apophysomyces sp. BC1021]|nr:hypothetical protein DFQ29_004736 [Apophysomyces sp. BC1021]
MSLPLEQVDQLHYQNMAEMQQDCPSLMLSAQEQGLGLLPFSEPGFSDASSYSSDHWKHNPPIEKDLPSSPEKVLSNLCLHNVDQKEASPAKPGLRLHIPKQWQHSRNTKVAPDTAQINPHLYESSMKPRVDAKTLRRLTLAVLRSLCIPVDINEIPIIDCENPSLDDVHLPVPATAMRLMTVMVLGTSGDKRVCETIGSQISNGDLIALQRTITATMHTKNIINRPLITTAATDAYRNGRSAMHEKNMDGIYDLSFVQFKPVATVTPLFFRLYRFIIDTLVSTPECWRFMNSIPLATPAYHDKESHPMDLSTVELNAWHGKYTTFVQFEQDLQLVWNNAADFHQNMCPIPKNERCLEDLFYDIVNTLKQPIWSQGVYMPEKHAFDPTRQIPEEIDHPDLSVDELFFKNKMVYIIPSVASDEQNVLQGRGLGDSRSSAIQLNRPFFQAVERMKANLTNTCTPIPRFYIASSGAFSKESLETAVYVILYNIRVTQTEEKHFVAETDVVLAIQACEIHDVENIKNDPKDPRLYGWMHMKPLRAMERIVFRINESIQRDYFHKTFAPFKVVYVSEEDESGLSSTERYLKHMVQIVFNISDGKGKRETFVDGISHKYGVTRAGGSGTADVTDRRNKNIQPTDQEVQAAANIQFGVKCIKNVNGSNETPEIMYDVWQKLLNSKASIYNK